MKNTTILHSWAMYSLMFLMPVLATAQVDEPKPNAFKVGDKVEADYSGWYPGVVVGVDDGGYGYKVEVYPPNGGKAFQYPFHFKRVRKPVLPETPPKKPEIDTKLVYGKYGCTASSYRGGFVYYTPRGSFEINAKGNYIYFGFERPSTGTYTVDKKGNLSFKGGYMNGGFAEKIDRPNKFFVVFPGIPDNRWTCGLVNND